MQLEKVQKTGKTNEMAESPRQHTTQRLADDLTGNIWMNSQNFVAPDPRFRKIHAALHIFAYLREVIMLHQLGSGVGGSGQLAHTS